MLSAMARDWESGNGARLVLCVLPGFGGARERSLNMHLHLALLCASGRFLNAKMFFGFCFPLASSLPFTACSEGCFGSRLNGGVFVIFQLCFLFLILFSLFTFHVPIWLSLQFLHSSSSSSFFSSSSTFPKSSFFSLTFQHVPSIFSLFRPPKIF